MSVGHCRCLPILFLLFFVVVAAAAAAAAAAVFVLRINTREVN